MMRKSHPIHIVTLFLSSSLCLAQRQAVDLTDLLIGTSNEGQTFPAVGVPFGMTQWTAETRPGEDKCVPPYFLKDTRIYGFRGSHFLSGSCAQDYGSMTLMPLGNAESRSGKVRLSSAFQHTNEVRKPYLYSVDLLDTNIHVDLTGTARSGLLRFRFPHGGTDMVVVQSNARKGDGAIHIDPARREISGSNRVRRIYAGAGQLAGFSGYFVMQFDHRFTVSGTWSGPLTKNSVDELSTESLRKGSFDQAADLGAPRALLSFHLASGETVEARVGTSFTSVEDARQNLKAEIQDWNFANVEAAARNAWSRELDKIEIAGDSPARKVFYTALYHAMLLPRIFSDVSGHYPSFGGGATIETAKDYTYYCDYSLWDTFRAVHPLFTLIDPGRNADMVRSLVEKGKQGGFLPIFPAWNSYTSEMVGDHAGAVIVDAYEKGIRGFDEKEAYRLMRKNALQLPADAALYRDGRGRRALESYLKYGYIPLEDHVPFAFHGNEQVSRTLEYAYDDFIVSEMADAVGARADAQLFRRRSQNYRNVIDPATGFARGRHSDGLWETPFDPGAANTAFTEANSYQYTFFAPQDIDGLIALLHGPKAFASKLDDLFAKGYYEQGNEPSHEIAYLYDYVDQAYKTQAQVRRIMDTLYTDSPSGLPGNDDAGQMSAWYVFSALGFYPVSPGIPVYTIGTPRFDHVTILLDNGKRFHIDAPGAEAGSFYVRSMTLNGVPLTKPFLPHAAIIAGGELRFTMTNQPPTQP